MDERPPAAQPWPPPAATPISFADAADIVAAHSRAILSRSHPDTSACPLEQALGRVLAADIHADRDQPPFPRVTRDGFAVRAADVQAGHALQVTGELRAGQPWPAERPPLGPGEALEIMTGAALPPGADSVLMVEHAETLPAAALPTPSSVRRIRPLPGRSLAAGDNVVPQGSEARHGDIVLPAGTRIGPEEIALAAYCGLSAAPVFDPVPVAILATGDELVAASSPGDDPPAASPLAPHQIYDSNSHSLAALVRQSHATPLRFGSVPDDKSSLAAAITRALDRAPLLLLTGGVSMGRYDLVEEVLAALGAQFFFTGVRMQPGKPVVFGCIPESSTGPLRYFFGLPGNPVSTMVTFRLFVRPLLAALSAEQNWQPPMALAVLASRVQGKPGLMRFVPAQLDTTQAVPTVTPLQSHGSGDLAAQARANCYLVVPEGEPGLAAGSTARVLLL